MARGRSTSDRAMRPSPEVVTRRMERLVLASLRPDGGMRTRAAGALPRRREDAARGRPPGALPRRSRDRDRGLGSGAHERRGQEEAASPLATVSPGDVAEALVDEEGFSRRRVLQAGLLAALGGLGAALAVPVLSLGPAPGRSLFRTPWRTGLPARGLRRPAGPADADPGRTASSRSFPEGSVGDADGQAMLINAGAEPAAARRRARRRGRPGGFVAYSKVCTHAGCPVGLYRASQGVLICPCHQSTFDVMRGARAHVRAGRAALPQLPIRLEADGTFTALGDFPEPVGPSFWDMTVRRHTGGGVTERPRPARTRPTELERLPPGSTSGRASPASSGQPCARSSRTTGRSCWARSRCSAS